MRNRNVGIIGVGHYTPNKIQTNEELCELIPELSVDWILNKTGIKKRHHISDDETASSIAVKACENVFYNSKVLPEEVDLVIVASCSQDYLFPPLSAKIHLHFNLKKNCQILDVNTNCVGLVTALTIASERIMCDLTINKALVIGVEVMSKYTNPTDRDTAVFFSDGASATILGRVKNELGFKSAKFMTDSSTYESVRLRGGGSSYPIAKRFSDPKILYVEQNGLATWKQAITNLPLVIHKVVDNESLKIEEIDFFIFHQANKFLIEYLMKKMKIPLSKTYINVTEIGNTGSASIGIALSEAYSKGLIIKNSNLLIAGVGAGFNFGACIFKF